MQELQGRKESLHALAFTADNRFLVIGGVACRVDVWNLADPSAKRPLFPKMGSTIGAVWVSPDGQRIVAAELRGPVVQLRLGDPRAVEPFIAESFIPAGADSMAAPQITPKGDGVVTGRALARWEFAAGTKPVWQARATSGPKPKPSAVAIAPDDRRVAAGEALYADPYTAVGYRVAVYDMTRSAGPQIFDAVNTFVKRLAWSPGGEHLAAAIDTRVVVWKADGTRVSEFETPGPRHVIDLAFHPTGRWLAVADNAGAVRLLNTATWAESRCFAWGLPKARSVAFSPDGTLAAVGSDVGKIVVWDVDL